jgi:hypothetical protein
MEESIDKVEEFLNVEKNWIYIAEGNEHIVLKCKCD